MAAHSAGRDGGPRTFSRRAVLRAGALGAAAVAAGVALPGSAGEADVTQDRPLAIGVYALNRGWWFGGVYEPGAESRPGDPGHGDPTVGGEPVTLPHTVVPLSWSDWTPSSWEKLWIYRRHVSAAALSRGRAFVEFQGVMTSATVYLNGVALGTHRGGYLPFAVELTEHLVAGDNVLAVVVDGTVQDVPPDNPAGAARVDYLQPAGIYRDVALRIVPEVHVADVFARPTNVLGDAPGLDAHVTVDAATLPPGPVTVTASVVDSSGVRVGSTSRELTLTRTGATQLTLSIASLRGISLWSPESPTLYGVRVTVDAPGGATHAFTTRTGFRTAEFRPDGFYLNGRRYQLFGLNRHQHFPYVGAAAPARLQRRDAEILRDELHCNMVRCSHYPQSDWFLDACDELGLMVWKETPGWQYVGQNAEFQDLVLQNMSDLIVRDRSRPSVIVWATRLNETTTRSDSPTGPANVDLYDRTGALAAELDGTRQTTGAMIDYSLDGWRQQVFAYDDYTNSDHAEVRLKPPISRALPYLVSESVGALDGAPLYRWIDPSGTLTLQARLHAAAHSQAGNAGYAGLLGWAGIDFASLNGESDSPPEGESADTPTSRVWLNLKTCGVLDTFRAVKPGGAFYRSQRATGSDSFVAPAFTWDPSTILGSPQDGAIVFTDCAAVRVTVAGVAPQTVTPDAASYPHLAHPPAFVDLPAVPAGNPDLLIEGLDGAGRMVASVTMSADPARDQLVLSTDHAELVGDGSDGTRVTARVLDAYGNQRRVPDGSIALRASGPARLHADPTFDLSQYGGVTGGILVAAPGATGTVLVGAVHPTLGTRTASVEVTAGALAAVAAGAGGVRSLGPRPMLPAPPLTPAPGPSAAPGRPRRPRATPRGHDGHRDAAIRAALHRMLAVRGRRAHVSAVIRTGHTASFHAPSAGTLHIGWYAHPHAHGDSRGHHHHHHRHRVLVATATAHVADAGRARIHIRLTARGHTLLRRAEHHHRHEALVAEASFTPAGGQPVTARRRITLAR